MLHSNRAGQLKRNGEIEAAIKKVTPRKDQDILLYDSSRLSYKAHAVTTDSYPSVPNRPLQTVVFTHSGKDLNLINAHIPGDPHLPVRDEFAQYIHSIHTNHSVTVSLGDNNFERNEMIPAYQKSGFSEFSPHSPSKTNVAPPTKTSKAIDHIFIAGDHHSRDLQPSEVLQGYRLEETLALLS